MLLLVIINIVVVENSTKNKAIESGREAPQTIKEFLDERQDLLSINSCLETLSLDFY